MQEVITVEVREEEEEEINMIIEEAIDKVIEKTSAPSQAGMTKTQTMASMGGMIGNLKAQLQEEEAQDQQAIPEETSHRIQGIATTQKEEEEMTQEAEEMRITDKKEGIEVTGVTVGIEEDTGTPELDD